ncbi:hypothetical protein [Sphingosinicella humi]|nr:hypothetical protein [Sphingosinicella humi]
MTTQITSSAPTNSLPPVPVTRGLDSTSRSTDCCDLVIPDPLDFDRPDDPVVVLSHRQVGRLVFVAAETGSRFTRERSPHDPAAWMCAPRRLFGGSNAVSACVDRDMFIRALVLHGISPALDMEPAEMDMLLEDGSELPDRVEESSAARSTSVGPATPVFNRLKTRLLFTATFVDEFGVGVSHIFFATVARDEDEVRNKLTSRVGARVSYMATVDIGFDPSEPVALSLLSDAMAEMLRQIEDAPTSPLSDGFSLLVEHRFDA